MNAKVKFEFYPEGNRETLEDFKQGVIVIKPAFQKAVLKAVWREICGVGERKQKYKEDNAFYLNMLSLR